MNNIALIVAGSVAGAAILFLLAGTPQFNIPDAPPPPPPDPNEPKSEALFPHSTTTLRVQFGKDVIRLHTPVETCVTWSNSPRSLEVVKSTKTYTDIRAPWPGVYEFKTLPAGHPQCVATDKAWAEKLKK